MAKYGPQGGSQPPIAMPPKTPGVSRPTPETPGVSRPPVKRRPPPKNGGSGPNGNGACCQSCANGRKCEKDCNGMQHEMEYWDCQGGFLAVELDGQGCPLQDKYCKIQVGPPGGPVSAGPGAAWTVTITIANFTWAKIRGLVLAAFDAAAGNADLLHTQSVTSVDVQGIENISGTVAAERYRADATGSGKASGTQQKWRGTIGSAAGAITIVGFNNSLATVTVLAALDVDAMR